MSFQAGNAYITVTPSMRGFHRTAAREMQRGIPAAVVSAQGPTRRAAGRVGTVAGSALVAGSSAVMGRNFTQAFQSAFGRARAVADTTGARAGRAFAVSTAAGMVGGSRAIQTAATRPFRGALNAVPAVAAATGLAFNNAAVSSLARRAPGIQQVAERPFRGALAGVPAVAAATGLGYSSAISSSLAGRASHIRNAVTTPFTGAMAGVASVAGATGLAYSNAAASSLAAGGARAGRGFLGSLGGALGRGTAAVVGAATAIGGSLASAFGVAGATAGTGFLASFTRMLGPLAGILSLGAILGGGFTRLADIDDARAKFQGLGYTAEEIDGQMDSALESVKGTTIGLDEAATASVGAAAAGVEMGEDMTGWLTAIGDATAQSNVEYGHMAQIMNKVQGQGTVMLGDLRQMSQNGFEATAILSKELGVTTAEVEEMASAGEISAEMFEEALTNQIGGSAKEMSKTLRGSVKEAMFQLKIMGAELLDSSGAADFLRDSMNRFSSFLENTVTPAIGTIMERVREWIAEVREWVSANEAWLRPLAVGLAGALVGFLAFKVVAGIIYGIRIAVLLLSRAIYQIPIVGWIAAALAGLYAFFKYTEVGRGIWTRVWGWITNVTARFVGWWQGNAWPAIQRVFQWIGRVATWLYQNALLPAWNGIRTAISAVVSWVQTTGWPILQSVFRVIGSVAMWLWRNALLPAWRGIRSAISTVVSWIRTHVQPTISTVFDAIGTVIRWLYNNVVRRYFQAWQVAFRTVVRVISTVWSSVLSPVFSTIGTVIRWLYNNVARPVFSTIGSAFSSLGSVIRGVWTGVLRPTIQLVADIIRWLWRNVARPLFAFIWQRFQTLGQRFQSVWRGVLRPVIRLIADIILWLWRNIVRPYFQNIWSLFQRLGRFFTATWRNVIRPMFQRFGAFVRDVWRNRIRPAFNAIRDGFSWLRDRLRDIWQNRIRPVFQAVGDFVRNNLVDRIKRGVELIRDAWNRVANFFRTPINWVINTVWNDGIKKAFDAVAKAVGSDARLASVSEIPRFGGSGGGGRGSSGGIGAVNARAKGGYTPKGWTLVGEEGPELVDFQTPGRVYTAGQTRGMMSVDEDVSPAASQWLAGASPAEAMLPMGGWLSKAVSWVADKASSVISWVRGGLAKAAESLLMPLLKTASSKMSTFGGMGKLGSGLIDSGVDRLMDWIKGEDDKAEAFGEDGTPFDGERGSFFRPSRGPITSWFGPRWGTIHSGIDIAGGGPTYAAYAGRVARTGWNVLPGRTGLGILLNHGGGLTTYYGHNPVGGIRVSPGDEVSRGQRIGAQGATGNVTGVHLHWERLMNGRAQNVNSMFRDKGGLIYPGVNQVLNKTGGAEYVSNQRQFDNLNAMAERATSGQGGDTITLHGVNHDQARANIKEIRRQQRLSAMRVGAR